MEKQVKPWGAVGQSHVPHPKSRFISIADNFIGKAGAAFSESWLPAALLPSVLILWGLSLPFIDLNAQSDLGLLTVLPFTFFFALILLLVSFSWVVYYRPRHTFVLFLHIVTLALLIFGTRAVLSGRSISGGMTLQGEPSISADGHSPWGLVSMDNPTLESLKALFFDAMGGRANPGIGLWTPLFLCIIISGALYLIFSSLTEDQRLVWSTIWFFNLTSWGLYLLPVEYGVAYFLYLTLIGMIMRWFRWTPPIQLVKFRARTITENASVYTYRRPAIHDSSNFVTPSDTPFDGWVLLLAVIFLLASVIILGNKFFATALTITLVLFAMFHRIAPRRLSWIVAGCTIGWILFGAATRLYLLPGFSLQKFQTGYKVVQTLVDARSGSGATFIQLVGYALMLLVCLLAVEGFFWRILHRSIDLSVLLFAGAAVPLSLFLIQAGGYFYLAYMLALPSFTFFIAALFYVRPLSRSSQWTPFLMTLLAIILSSGSLISLFGLAIT